MIRCETNGLISDYYSVFTPARCEVRRFFEKISSIHHIINVLIIFLNSFETSAVKFAFLLFFIML